MGTHPIFESDFDCLTVKMPATNLTEDEQLEAFFMENISSSQTAILAMETLNKAIEIDKGSNTVMELVDRLKTVRKMLDKFDTVPQKTSIQSGTDLFLRFTTHMVQNILHVESDIGRVKKALVDHGADCIKNMKCLREKAANEARKFIPDSASILTHGNSRAVIDVLKNAYQEGKVKKIYYTMDASGNTEMREFMDEMQQNGVECYEVLTRTVAYLMERVDLVLIGAEAVVESGSVISAVGSYGIAMAAHVHKKEFYVVCESFKFIRSYPMKQIEVEQQHKYLNGGKEHPISDLTPAEFITLLITDLGPLTPEAVGHHLIKLYT